MEPSRYTHTSEVAAPIEDVWNFVTAPEGFNTELMPIMKMTVPRAMKGRTIAELTPGDHVGRSWLLLAGLLPFEFDNMTLAEIDPGTRFLEQSSMGSIRHWQHERCLASTSTGDTRVTDNIEYVMRLPLPGSARMAGAILNKLFTHRHRQLAKRFNR